MNKDSCQSITYTRKSKVIRTRIADGLFTKVICSKNKKEFYLYNYDKLLSKIEV